jgi:hypothetical protein
MAFKAGVTGGPSATRLGIQTAQDYEQIAFAGLSSMKPIQSDSA